MRHLIIFEQIEVADWIEDFVGIIYTFITPQMQSIETTYLCCWLNFY
jgi:hypothetical protein